MICHQCGVWSDVLSTRQQQQGLVVKRERQCANGHRFSTLEKLIERPPPRGPEYCRRHAAGESINHIAHSCGVSRDAVRRAINRQKAKT